MSGDESVNQLLGSLSYEAERGALSLSSARYVMLSPALFVELQKASKRISLRRWRKS